MDQNFSIIYKCLIIIVSLPLSQPFSSGLVVDFSPVAKLDITSLIYHFSFESLVLVSHDVISIRDYVIITSFIMMSLFTSSAVSISALLHFSYLLFQVAISLSRTVIVLDI